MNLLGVARLLDGGYALTLGDISYALIEGRIQRVVLWEEETTPEGSETQTFSFTYEAFPIDLSLANFESFCESFNASLPNATLLLPEKKKNLSEDGLYDFSKVPFMECPKCFASVGPKNVIQEGRYAYCPKCGKQLYKAPRVDGQRDEPEFVEKPKSVWGSKGKKEKPVEVTLEQHLEKAEGKTRKVKLNFGSSLLN